MRDVLAHTSAARFASRKRARANQLLSSSIPVWLKTRTIREVGQQPMELWTRVANTMNQPMHAKTIAVAIKVFDLMYKIETGVYVSFPARVPILVDLRIARVSLASGLMGSLESTLLEQLMLGAQHYADLERAAILDAWAEVSECTGGLSLFRIDGLVWQVANVVHERRNRPAAVAAGVAATLRDYGASESSAAHLAAELTRALGKYLDQKVNPAVATANAKIAEPEARLAELERRAATPPTAPAVIANPATGKVESK